MAVQARVESIHILEMITDPNRKERARGNTKKLVRYSMSRLTEHCGRCGIEIKIGSMKTHKTQSWIAISRGVNKYVMELPEENKQPIHCDEASSSTGRPVAMEQKEQLVPSSSSSPTLPINQRKWNDLPAVRRVDDCSYQISKIMTGHLRHQSYPREDDGAVEWRKLL